MEGDGRPQVHCVATTVDSLLGGVLEERLVEFGAHLNEEAGVMVSRLRAAHNARRSLIVRELAPLHRLGRHFVPAHKVFSTVPMMVRTYTDTQ